MEQQAAMGTLRPDHSLKGLNLSENPSWNNNFTPVDRWWHMVTDGFGSCSGQLIFGCTGEKIVRQIQRDPNNQPYTNRFANPLQSTKFGAFWGKFPSDVRLLLRWRHPEQDVWSCIEHRMFLWRHVQRSVPCRSWIAVLNHSWSKASFEAPELPFLKVLSQVGFCCWSSLLSQWWSKGTQTMIIHNHSHAITVFHFYIHLRRRLGLSGATVLSRAKIHRTCIHAVSVVACTVDLGKVVSMHKNEHWDSYFLFIDVTRALTLNTCLRWCRMLVFTFMADTCWLILF